MSHESYAYDDAGQNVVIKMCSVNLRRLSSKVDYKEGSSSSEDELPPLPFSLSASRSTRKSRKSSKDLREEFESLANDITADNLCESNISETLRRMDVEDTVEVEEEHILSPIPVKEEREFKIFAVNETLLFFNCTDITLLQCGYEHSLNHTCYEEELLSYNRVELEHVLCSFLYLNNVHSVSDCKSFADYLLKNLSVHSDVGCVEACSRVLELLLKNHPDACKLTYHASDIFMLFFNYGTDCTNFKILQADQNPGMDYQIHQKKSSFKSSNKVPQSWMINLTFVLDAMMCLLDCLTFDAEDLGWMATYFLYMTLDSDIFRGNLIRNINKLIFESLDLISTMEWPKIMNKIASTFMCLEFSSLRVKWCKILQLVQCLPATSERLLQLKKYISFLALNHLGKHQSAIESSEDIVDLNETLNISQLESLLKLILIDRMDPELISFGVKFLDICISHIKATDEDIEKLCSTLKRAESALNEQAYEAKAHFVKMHARMKIRLGKNSFYKVAPEKKLTIKKELVETENVSCTFDLDNVKKEPGLESTTPSIIENDERLIRFSDFDCDNDDVDLDFDNIGKDISSNDCLNAAEAAAEDNMTDLPVITATYSASSNAENDAVSSNLVISNPSLLKSEISASIKVEPLTESDTEISKLSVLESPMLEVANRIDKSVLVSDNTLMSSEVYKTVSVKSDESGEINVNNSDKLDDNCVPVLSSDLACGFTTDNQIDFGKSSKQVDPVIINVEDVTLLANSLQSSNSLVEETCNAVQADNPSDAVFFTAATTLNNQTESGKSSEQLDSVIMNTSSKQVNPVIINVDQVSDVTLLAKSLQSSNSLVEESRNSVQADNPPDAVFFTAVTTFDNQTDSGKSSEQLDPVIVNTSSNQVNPVIINVDQVSDITLLAKSLQSSNSLVEESRNSVQADNPSDAVFITAVTTLDNRTESGMSSEQLDPVIMNTSQSLKDASPPNNLSDHSPPADNCNFDSGFSSAVGNRSNVFAQLAESLALPKGTEISPIKTDSTKQRKSSMLPHFPGVASGEISMTIIEDEIEIVDEIASPKKSKKRNILDSEDSDLQILFSKPVAKSSKSKNKSSKVNQNKLSSSKSSDEDVTILTEIHNNSGDKDSDIISIRITESDDKNDEVNNENVKSDNINETLPQISSVQNSEKISSLNEETAATVFTEEEIFVSIEADEDKSKELKVDVRNSLMKNEDSENIHILTENPKPEVAKNDVSLSMEVEEITKKLLEETVHASEVDQNKLTNSNEINAQTSAQAEFEPTANLRNTPSPKAKESFETEFVHKVFENDSSREAKLMKDTVRQKEESVEISNSEKNLIEKLFLDDKDKREKICEIETEKTAVVVKKLFKRKSVDEDIENKRLKSEGNDSIEEDANCVLNNLLDSLVKMNSDCVDKSLYNNTSGDKSPLHAHVNQTRTFQNKSSCNFLNLNALIEPKKSKASKHLKVIAQTKRKREICSPSTNEQNYAATNDDLQLLKIAKKGKTKSPVKFSPKKFLSPKKLKSRHSPSKYFDYLQKRSNYCAFNKIKRTDLLTQTGLNLKNILKEKTQSPPLPSHFHQNSHQTENYVLSDSDSDVMELYVDPKRYRDKECLVIYESEEIIVIDSD